jgi:hypothetical protein
VDFSSYDHVIIGNTFNLDNTAVPMVMANKNTENIYANGNIRSPPGTNYQGNINQNDLPYWYSDRKPSGQCTTPEAIFLLSVTTGSAVATWTTIPGAKSYDIRYKSSISSTWISQTGISVTNLTLPSLSPSAIYDIQLRAICSQTSSSSFSVNTQFKTRSLATPKPTSSPTLPPTPSPIPSVDISNSHTIFSNVAVNSDFWNNLSTNGLFLYNYNDGGSHKSSLYAQLQPYGKVHFESRGADLTDLTGLNEVRFFIRGITTGTIRMKVNSRSAHFSVDQAWHEHSFDYSFWLQGSDVSTVLFENIGTGPVTLLLDDIRFVP